MCVLVVGSGTVECESSRKRTCESRKEEICVPCMYLSRLVSCRFRSWSFIGRGVLWVRGWGDSAV
jgi:hypothetical protein